MITLYKHAVCLVASALVGGIVIQFVTPVAAFQPCAITHRQECFLRMSTVDFLDHLNSVQNGNASQTIENDNYDGEDDDFVANLLSEISSSSEHPLSDSEEPDEPINATPTIINPTLSLWDMAAMHKAKYQEMKKIEEGSPPSLLGIKSVGVDYGLVRTGVATTVGYDPKPLAILSDLNNTQVCQKVLQYARMEQASKIIVGLPLHKNGTVALQTNLTLVFAQELSQAALVEMGPNVPVELWDERYTSKEAAARAHAQDPNRFLYGSLDADAACIILEHYYHDHGIGRIEVPVVPDDVRAECLKRFESKQSKEEVRRLGALKEREERMQRRKNAIAQAQKMRDSEQKSTSSKKKKKKRKK